MLLAFGVHTLRRQAVGEFADARAGDAMNSIRGWYERRHQPQLAASGQAPAPVSGDHIEELERLAQLHDSGALTDTEFAAEKAALRNPA